FDQEDKALFLGSPHFISDFADATATEFRIYFKNNKIEKAELQDSCYVKFRTEHDKEKRNWIDSDYMELQFEDSKIRLCQAESNVISFFEQPANDKQDFMKNESTAEELLLFISNNNELEKIEMKQNVDGKYTFEPN
ncbi:MAG: hypothetical protein SVM86_01055, partial [Candidatus Cloacimonadota bacterium]|nr:hypothetical protein [Candidatus Cloacimonadota bacterium]